MTGGHTGRQEFAALIQDRACLCNGEVPLLVGINEGDFVRDVRPDGDALPAFFLQCGHNFRCKTLGRHFFAILHDNRSPITERFAHEPADERIGIHGEGVHDFAVRSLEEAVLVALG